MGDPLKTGRFKNDSFIDLCFFMLHRCLTGNWWEGGLFLDICNSAIVDAAQCFDGAPDSSHELPS